MTNMTTEIPGDIIHKPIYELIILTVINVCIFIVGSIGNVITCIVIASNKSMHTTTNCYLFNLAISDLLLLIAGIPYEIYNILHSYKNLAAKFGCFWHFWLLETSIVVSNLTVTAFTVERYLGICRPFVAQIMSQIPRTTKIIACIWFIAALSTLGLVWENEYIVWQGEAICVYIRNIMPYYLEILTLIFYVLPVTIIIVLYVLIGIAVVRSSKLQKARGDAKEQTTGIDSSTKKVLKMLVAVVVAFFICWTPFHAQRVYTVNPTLFVDEADLKINTTFDIVWFYISGVLYFVSAVINPIIYSTMSDKFRNAFKETLMKSRNTFRQFKISRLTVTNKNNDNNVFGVADTVL